MRYVGKYGVDTWEPMSDDARDTFFVDWEFSSWIKFGYFKPCIWALHLLSEFKKEFGW